MRAEANAVCLSYSLNMKLTDPFRWTGWIPLSPPVLEPSAGVTDMGHSVDPHMVVKDLNSDPLLPLQLKPCSSSSSIVLQGCVPNGGSRHQLPFELLKGTYVPSTFNS